MTPELAFWQVRALQRGAKLRVDPATINEAVGTLATVFGNAWLAEACQGDPAHPLHFAATPWEISCSPRERIRSRVHWSWSSTCPHSRQGWSATGTSDPKRVQNVNMYVTLGRD